MGLFGYADGVLFRQSAGATTLGQHFATPAARARAAFWGADGTGLVAGCMDDLACCEAFSPRCRRQGKVGKKLGNQSMAPACCDVGDSRYFLLHAVAGGAVGLHRRIV